MFNFLKFLEQLSRFSFGDDDGGGSGDGGSGDGGDGGAGNGGDADRVAQLESQLQSVVGVVTGLAQGQQTMQATMQQLTETLAKSANPPPKEDDDINFDDVDLETMSRADLIKLMTTNTEKMVAKALEGVGKKIDGVSGKLDETITSYTVTEFQKEHKDLMEWKSEIHDILKAGRAATVADAYTLVRAQNPDKAQKMDLKYNPPVKKDGEGKVQLNTFRGFPPSGGGQGGGSGKNQRMTPQLAASAAWDEAIAAMPGVEQFLSNDQTMTQ